MPEKTQDIPLLNSGEFTISKKVELECVNDKSSKTYLIELQLSKKDTRAQLFSMWGKIGNNLVSDWRYYDSFEKATKEFESIVKLKKKKGYEEV